MEEINVNEDNILMKEFYNIYTINLIISIFSFVLSTLFFCSYCSRTSSRNASLILKIILGCDLFATLGTIARNIHGLIQDDYKFKELYMISIYSCIFNYHIIWITIFYLLPILFVFVLALDRYLAINFSLWFKTVNISKGPLIGYCFLTVTFTIIVGILNAVYISPLEKIHYTCPIFEGFGFQYSYGIKIFIIIYLSFSLLLNTIALKQIISKDGTKRFGGFHSRHKFESRMTKRSFYITLYFTTSTIIPLILTLIIDSKPNTWTPLKEGISSLIFLRTIINCIAIWRIFPRYVNFKFCNKTKSQNAVQEVQHNANYTHHNAFSG
ncbi:G protein-coupled receptor, rhodopsin-like family-containing protein [Strongyloides ratti]|uniref:G protein-coupled receptor, rhodopsin-like family-containing protein n=1 Tax=Strongyloides ratti TaxID=34506 RepID=A0A090LPA9_STRRB|nr:G protein-coupled receptor, rhodopsin-like family-containing protein [Strongyloides ratti]CEF71596.1 G protein-coupled receptor, rhodopsin-like family-containing protein [Strongyloides ratti]